VFMQLHISKILAVTTLCLDDGCMKFILLSVLNQAACRQSS
jgi:hypothetical protein